MGRSLKAQMKYAGKLNARYAIVIGDDEIKSGKAIIKNMSDGTMTEINIDNEGLIKVKEIIGGRYNE